MSSLIGFSSLVIALILNLILFLLEFTKKIRNQNFFYIIRISAFFTLISFVSLIYAYVISDFSNFNVFNNSHSDKPLIYKIAGSWGNHEGSMLMWVSIMSLYSFIFSLDKNVTEQFKRQTLIIQNGLFVCFVLFILFTSNPFLVNSIEVKEGLGLNPILQDPALAIHPPMLYAGYLGYSIIFSFAIAGLLQNKLDIDWINLTRKWSLISWTFLTAGIALGSYWAYYELGWGGWWFWDPVENISLMPWITGLALVHSLFIAKAENLMLKWIVFLSILCFSLTIFGTFLVRSGVLTSVHSFASDASRGLFILLIFFIITSFGLLVLLIRQPEKNKNLKLLFLNKTSALVINNILMIIATLTILLGTIYPIIIEVITNSRISVGGPYFNSTVLPIMLPGFLLMSIAPVLAWQSNKLRKAKYYFFGFLILSLIILIQSLLTSFNPWGFLGTLLGSWVIVASIISIFFSYKFSLSFQYLKNINTFIAHLGVGIVIIGITFSTIFKFENNYLLEKGNEVMLGSTKIIFEEISIENKKNYQSLRAHFLINKNNIIVGEILAGKNYYPVSKIITTEAGIFHDWHRDIYIVLGDQENNKWSVNIHNNPLVSLIWFGILIMVFSGFIGSLKK